MYYLAHFSLLASQYAGALHVIGALIGTVLAILLILALAYGIGHIIQLCRKFTPPKDTRGRYFANALLTYLWPYYAAIWYFSLPAGHPRRENAKTHLVIAVVLYIIVIYILTH